MDSLLIRNFPPCIHIITNASHARGQGYASLANANAAQAGLSAAQAQQLLASGLTAQQLQTLAAQVLGSSHSVALHSWSQALLCRCALLWCHRRTHVHCNAGTAGTRFADNVSDFPIQGLLQQAAAQAAQQQAQQQQQQGLGSHSQVSCTLTSMRSGIPQKTQPQEPELWQCKNSRKQIPLQSTSRSEWCTGVMSCSAR